eukprot:COSAG02_NODE_23508_length_716_cov_1.888169_1_plen_168_part_10
MDTHSRPAKRRRRQSDGDGDGDGGDRPLAGLCVVVSGIVNPERSELRDMALRLGAEYRGDWEGCCTHLLAPFDGTENGGRPTPKSTAARSSDGYVVKPSWLRACADEQRRVDESAHLLGAAPKRVARRAQPAAISLLDSSDDDSPPRRKPRSGGGSGGGGGVGSQSSA